jgi:hypothetical protein
MRIPEGRICLAEVEVRLREDGKRIPLHRQVIPLIKISSTE